MCYHHSEESDPVSAKHCEDHRGNGESGAGEAPGFLVIQMLLDGSTSFSKLFGQTLPL